jgi:hypothetical protein
MSLPEPADIEPLLLDLDRTEPTAYDLGTPEVSEVEAVRRLVDMGPPVVPLLLEHLRDDRRPSRMIAHLVLVLERLADVRALPELRALQERVRQRESKNEWDYAVIGRSTTAIERLERVRRQ